MAKKNGAKKNGAPRPAAGAAHSEGTGLAKLVDYVREYFAGEGKTAGEPITLDDLTHAVKFKGAAPDAK